MRKKRKAVLSSVRFLVLTCIAVGLLWLNGCGGTSDPLTGTFVDSPVAGLNYQTPTITGTTDAEGRFKYFEGETVTFSIGGLKLGSAVSGSVVTPISLVSGAVDVTNQTVTNLCVFLQTLDEDGDLNNGIKINTQTAAIVSNYTGINFNQASAAFSSDATVTALLAQLNSAGVFKDTGSVGGRKLCSTSEAQAHMQASLKPRTVVTTKFGSVRGYAPDDDTWAWKGIPYAKPPVGTLRWKAPQDPVPWTGVREATYQCKECTQQVNDKFWRYADDFKGSEDCLYLDIYRPRTSDTNLPVFVWIHGGSNHFGSSKQYNGAALAKRGKMIVVVIQYRLAALGFFTHPALRENKNALDASGNYAALDHQKALTWVKNNIDAFGGDPNNVTVGGQSAGAYNTLNLIISPLANGLFHKAVVQSGSVSAATLAQGDTQTNKLIEWLLVKDKLAANATEAANYRAGMSNAAIESYLTGKTAEEIMRARKDGVGGGSMPNNPAFYDGTVIPNTPWSTLFAAGNINKVPILIGNTREEIKDFLPLYGVPIKAAAPGVPSSSYTWLQLINVLDGTPVGGTTLSLNDILPTDADRNFYQTMANLRSRAFKVATDTITRTLRTQDANAKIYSFLFNWAGGGDPNLDAFKFITGAAHGVEIPFFFGNSNGLFDLGFTEANKAGRIALQGAMMDYLSSFIRTGDPNPSGFALPAWPQWTNEAGAAKMITFDANLNNYVIAADSIEETDRKSVV